MAFTMEWKTSHTPVDYEAAVKIMESRVRAIRAGEADELIWLLEHPPLYTAGTSANPRDLIGTPDFPVYKTGRGGQYTYHGPGQRIAYVMLDLHKRKPDLRWFVQSLEQWIIASLATLGVQGELRDGRIGVWVKTGDTEAKIAALGIRVRQWVTYHGIAINVNPDLSHYQPIVPCGIREHGVTSLAALGVKANMQDVDKALQQTFVHSPH